MQHDTLHTIYIYIYRSTHYLYRYTPLTTGEGSAPAQSVLRFSKSVLCVCVFPVWVPLRPPVRWLLAALRGPLCGGPLLCGPLCGSPRRLLLAAFRSAFLRHSFSVICLSFAASAAVLSHTTLIFSKKTKKIGSKRRKNSK